VAFSPDAKAIVSTDGCVVKVWDPQTGAERLLPGELLPKK
jgi:hypothetical protein